ncbi:hypothetical protein BRC90_05785 [Halobacteriales archaeon QS_4_69_34]|nr:MAG: hypothetical protein BRC90_05785 [Halobacteriales archaeon QS_4_69_34]
MADIEAEREMSRADVADYLRKFADELDAAREMSFGDEQGEDATGATGGTDSAGRTGPSSGDPAASDDARATERAGDRESDEHGHRGEDAVTTGSGTDDAARRGEKVTFMVGNESATINPPGAVTFEMAVDSQSSLIGTGTGRTARFALHWDEEDVPADDELSIQ